MNVPPQDRLLFKFFGWCYVAVAFAVILFPRYIVLFALVVGTSVMIGVLGIRSAFTHTHVPVFRRCCYFCLGVGFVVGGSIVAGRLHGHISTTGWLESFR